LIDNVVWTVVTSQQYDEGRSYCFYITLCMLVAFEVGILNLDWISTVGKGSFLLA